MGWLARALMVLAPCTVLVAGCGKDGASSPAPSPVCKSRDAAGQGADAGAAPSQFTAVTLDPGAPAPLWVAVQACVGLHNRKTGGSVYVEADPHDATWLDELGLDPATTVNAPDFLSSCVKDFPACVRYDYKAQQALLPNVLTVAAALGAVPLDSSLAIPCDKVAFDAVAKLEDKNTPALATQYVFDHYGKQTTGLAMINPGYEGQPKDPANPAITGDINPALVDFVFSRKLFVVYLINGCIDGNPEKDVLSSIVNAGIWPTPLGVYGYNSSWNVGGGDLYEAQTRCLDSRNMGAIASTTENLSFFSTRAPGADASAFEQNELEPIKYDPGKTYVAFVVGDGDNVRYMMTDRHDWFRQRLADCQSANGACPPATPGARSPGCT